MISMSLSAAAGHVDGKVSGPDIKFTGCSIDSRSVQRGNLFIAVCGERVDGHSFINAAKDNGANAAMVERPDSNSLLPLLVIQDSRKAMGRLAACWRDKFDIPLLAVTGSNGKTTVKEMISSILGLDAEVLATRGNLNNDLGVPLTLFGLGDNHRYAVIEMGANHPGEIAWLSQLARPTVALITQCAPAHLEGFGSVEGVARAKAEIFSGLDENGIAVINTDDDYAGLWRDTARQYRQIGFGLQSAADITATDIHFDPGPGHTSFILNTPAGAVSVSLPLAGDHNVNNALAASACCHALEIPVDRIKAGLERMKQVTGRMQMKHTGNGTRIFDDTYNANPVSLKAGLEVLSRYPGRKWLVLGDMGELGERALEFHRQAGEMARTSGIERLYALGDLGRFAVEGFGEGARHFDSSEELLNTLRSDAAADVTILMKGSRRMGMDAIVDAMVEGR